MLSSVGFEMMNSTNPELSWKSVTKGRRSKKSIARSLNSSIKVVNSISPKRVGDFSGSDFENFGEYIPAQKNLGKSENVPLKKRKHLLESPLPHTSASSLRNYTPSRTHASSILVEDHIQLQYPSCSSGDFSGIKLLAEAACMDYDIDDADKKDILPKDSLIPNNSDPSSSAVLSEQYSKNSQLVNLLSNINVPGDNTNSQENNSATDSQSLSADPEDGTQPKVDRKHWDLNTSMDSWGEPSDVMIAGDISKDVNGGRHAEDMKKHFGDHVPSHQTAITDEKPSLEVEQDIYSHLDKDISNEAYEMDPNDESVIKASTCDAHLERLDQVTNLDNTVDTSPFSKLCCSSGMLKSEEKDDAITGTVVIQGGDCSISKSECERIATLDRSRTYNNVVNAFDTVASESLIDIKPEDIEVPQKTSSPGTFTLDAKPVASTGSYKQIDGAFLSNSTVTDCKQYLQPAELGTKPDEDTLLHNEDSMRAMLDSCKNFSAGAQFDEPTSVGGIELALDGRHNPDVALDNHADMVNGDDLTGFQEGYDSSYEDGELRGSFLYSWQENEMENERVDYESDGRNGNGSYAAEYIGSEIVEGGSEGSNGSRRSLSLKISAEDKSKSGAVEHGLKKHAVNAESGNNEIAGKGSNAGSGSTVEQSVEMPMKENNGMKMLELLDHKNAVNVGAIHIDEHDSKDVKGKLQSRIEGQSSTDATDGKDVFFMHQSRSHRFAGSYPRPERDISPDRYLGRNTSAAPGESYGVHQWTSWGSRRHYTTNYQGHNNSRSRSKTGESANKIDAVDFHQPRQTSYQLKGLYRPLMRRSPVERDDYFGVGRRRPVTRGVGHYRSRGNYSQRPGRDFVDDFDPLPDDAGATVRMPHYISRRERSFSPSSGRQTNMTLPRRRYRSRSRTRSPPRAWQNSHRERMLGSRRLSRSPDFRYGARMERMRMPFTKPSFTSDYGEDYISPSRGRSSPQQNCRWIEDRNFGDNHLRRRRSPVRVFRRTQRFDDVGSSGRLKPDEYFRPVIRPGRFSFMGNGGRECKLESNYDDRRRDDGGEISHGGNTRRFRPNAGGGGDLETKNMKNVDDDIDVSEEREDKKAF